MPDTNRLAVDRGFEKWGDEMSVMMALALQAASVLDAWESKAAWSEQDRENAAVLAKAALGKWAECLSAARVRLKRSREPAETIAMGVLGSCLSDEKFARRVVTISFRGILEPSARTKAADEIIGKHREDTREATIAEVLTGRL